MEDKKEVDEPPKASDKLESIINSPQLSIYPTVCLGITGSVASIK
jgi:hypothetical protein